MVKVPSVLDLGTIVQFQKRLELLDHRSVICSYKVLENGSK